MKFNVIINGIDVLDQAIETLTNTSKTIERKLPSLKRQEKFDSFLTAVLFIFLFSGLMFLVIVIISNVNLIFNDARTSDIVYFLIFLVLILGFVALIIYLIIKIAKNRIRKNGPDSISSKIKIMNEGLNCSEFIKQQKESFITLLQNKEKLTDLEIKRIDNYYELNYAYSEDGDIVKNNQIIIDELSLSLKQNGAIIEISKYEEWFKKFKTSLRIEYSIYLQVQK